MGAMVLICEHYLQHLFIKIWLKLLHEVRLDEEVLQVVLQCTVHQKGTQVRFGIPEEIQTEYEKFDVKASINSIKENNLPRYLH